MIFFVFVGLERKVITIPQLSPTHHELLLLAGGGGTDIERGMCGPEDPLFTPLLQFTRVPFQAKESVHKTPFLRKCWDFSLYSLNFCPNFSSQAPKFGNFQLTSSQIWKISVHKTSFKRQVSVRKPHTSEIWAAHPLIPYLKKKKKKKLSAPRASCHLLGEVSNSLSNTATIDNIQTKWIIPESNDSLSAYLLPTLLVCNELLSDIFIIISCDSVVSSVLSKCN